MSCRQLEITLWRYVWRNLPYSYTTIIKNTLNIVIAVEFGDRIMKSVAIQSVNSTSRLGPYLWTWLYSLFLNHPPPNPLIKSNFQVKLKSNLHPLLHLSFTLHVFLDCAKNIDQLPTAKPFNLKWKKICPFNFLQ